MQILAHKTIVWVVVAVAVVWAFFFFSFQFGKQGQKVSGPINQLKEFNIAEGLPGFPSTESLPLPASAVVTRSYQSISPDGRVQSTKILTSSKSIQENLNYFKNLLSRRNSGWKILTTWDTATRRAVFAQNSGGFLNVYVYADDSGKTAIELSYLNQPSK